MKSSLTNEQLFRLFLQMIVCQSQERTKTMFLIVRMHRDEEEKSMGETGNRRKRRLQMLLLLQSHEHIIFAVNAKNPKDRDVALGYKNMIEVMNDTRARHVSIPLKYLNLDLTLKQLSTTEKLAFSVDEVFGLMTRYFESLKAGLEYLNKTFRVFYFCKLDLVVREPQLLLNFITKIIINHIE